MKKDEVLYVKVDSRNRVTIPKKLAKNIAQLYKVYEKDGAIVLEAVHEASKDEQWLMDPKNKAILDRLKEEAKQDDSHHRPQVQHPQNHNNQQRNPNTPNQQNNPHNPLNNNGSHNDKK